MKYLLILFSAFLSLGLSAQQPIGDNKTGFKKQGNDFLFSNTNGDVKISFCSPGLFRVRSAWNRSFEADEPWMVVKYNWPPVTVSATDNKEYISLKTAQLQVKVF